jgi:hypothetical protein
MLAMPSAFLAKESSAEIFARAANSYHAACTRRVSADLAPARVEVVTQIQSGSSRTDSPVRVLYAQPASQWDYVRFAEICATFRWGRTFERVVFADFWRPGRGDPAVSNVLIPDTAFSTRQ